MLAERCTSLPAPRWSGIIQGDAPCTSVVLPSDAVPASSRGPWLLGTTSDHPIRITELTHVWQIARVD